MPLLRFILLLFVCIIFKHSFFAQQLDYGPILIWNNSSQTNYDPTIPEDGTFQWNSLGTFGIGAYASKNLSKRMAIQLDFLYQQKGYKEIAQFDIIPQTPASFHEDEFRNTFNYISGDLSAKYFMVKGHMIEISANLGLEYNYLLAYEIASDLYPVNIFYPVNAYQNRWRKSNFSVLPSITLYFNHAATCQFGFNRSITPVLKTDNLIVKDWVWTFRFGLSLPEMFKA